MTVAMLHLTPTQTTAGDAAYITGIFTKRATATLLVSVSGWRHVPPVFPMEDLC